MFFARDYQSKLFPLLVSKKYNSVFIVLNKKEKQIVLDNGGKEIVCFEEEFESLPLERELNAYLEYSYGCDRHYKGLNLEERETILKKTIAFWEKVYDLYKPLYIVNETVAIEFAEVMAIEAKKRGVKYMSWMSFPKEDTFYWNDIPYHNSLGTLLDDVKINEKALQEADIFIKGVQSGVERPFYVKKSIKRHSILKLFKSIYSTLIVLKLKLKRTKLESKIFYYSPIELHIKEIKLFFLSVFGKYDNVNQESNYEMIFYPLHFEPEAVLFYMGYFFDNQVSVIENILKCMRQNQILLVKEHPQQLGLLLEKRFQEVKKRYPNLLFIKGEESTIHTMNKCSTVVTLGSTAGFEALALNKKVITLGKVFYDRFEGVNGCDSFNEVYDLFRGVKKIKTPENFNIFVAKMLRYIKKGNPFPHDNLYTEKNIKCIVKAIEDEIDNEN